MTWLEGLEPIADDAAACLLGEDIACRAKLASDIVTLLKRHDREPWSLTATRGIPAEGTQPRRAGADRRDMTSAPTSLAAQPAPSISPLVRRRLSLTSTPAQLAPLTTTHPGAAPRLQLVGPSAPLPPPLQSTVGELSAAQEASLVASLRATPRAGETLHARFHRVEAEVGHQLAQLTVAESRTLHQRLIRAAAGDPLATAFHRMVADRKARLLAFLADARRREALGRACQR